MDRTTQPSKDALTNAPPHQASFSVVAGEYGLDILRVQEIPRTPPTPRIGTVERECSSGVGKLQSRLLLMLDLERLKNEAEIGATVQ